MNSYLVSLATLVSINVILALSLNIVSGFCGQVSLGHAAFYGIGAYASAKLALAGVSTLPVFLLAMLAAGLVGLVVGFASLRVRNDFLAIATMGVGFVFLGIVRKSRWLGGELGLNGVPDPGFGAGVGLALVVLCAAGVAVFSVYLKRSWLGFAFDAIARDEDAARTLAIDVPRFKLAAFTLGTALAGLAGAFYVYFARSILPDSFGFLESIAILTMVVIGGLGSVTGVTLAAILLTLAPEVFRFVNDYRLLVFGAPLVLVMAVSPSGLGGLGTRLWRRAGAAR